MTSGLHQTMAAYKDAASKFSMEPLEPFKRVSHICFSCSIWPFWGSLQRLFRKLAVCSKRCWRSRFGGFLKWGYRKSSKSLDHDLVLEAMVTTGDPFFSGPPSVAFHQEFNVAGRSSVELDDSPGSIGAEQTLLSWHGYGSIPISTIFSGMNIHKSQLFWCELQGYMVLTHCHIPFEIILFFNLSWNMSASVPMMDPWCWYIC